MKRGLLVPLLISTLVLALGTVAAACGGGGDALTLDEYFQRIIAAQADRDAKGQAAEEKFSEGYESLSEEDQLKATRDYFNESVPVLSGFVEALADLNPPAEAEDANKQAVSAGEEVLEVARDVANRLADADTESEIQELFNDPELGAAGDRFTQTCVTLQGIADANGIVADLNCGADEG